MLVYEWKVNFAVKSLDIYGVSVVLVFINDFSYIDKAFYDYVLSSYEAIFN